MKFKYKDIITTDEYDDEFFQEITDLFMEDNQISKFKTAVKALHKYELHKELGKKESAIIQLFNSNIRWNIYEFFENEYYDDSELFEKLGLAAISLNEYSYDCMVNELLVVIGINLEDFSELNEGKLNKLKQETKIIDKNLKKSKPKNKIIDENLKKSKQETKIIDENLNKLKQEIKIIDENLNNSKQEIKIIDENLNKLKQEIKIIDENLNNSKQEIKIIDENLNKLKQETKIIDENLNNSKQETKIIDENLKKSKQEIKIIDENLKNLNYEATMTNILKTFRQYLLWLNVKSTDEIVNFYYFYKGWKIRALLSKEESFKRRKALINRKIDFNVNYRISKLRTSDNPLEKSTFLDCLLEDLKKYEQFIIQNFIKKSLSYYKDLTLNYYELVLTVLSLRNGIQIIDKYKELIEEGYYDSDNEALLREAVLTVDKNRNSLKLMSLNKIVKTLHINTKRAEEYGLEMLYLYTLSQGTKSRIRSKDVPERKSIQKARWLENAVETGKKVKIYRDKDLNFQEIGNKINLSREKVSEKYNAYILNEYKINKKKLKTNEELDNFAKSMHKSREDIDKLIGKTR